MGRIIVLDKILSKRFYVLNGKIVVSDTILQLIHIYCQTIKFMEI